MRCSDSLERPFPVLCNPITSVLIEKPGLLRWEGLRALDGPLQVVSDDLNTCAYDATVAGQAPKAQQRMVV